MPLLLSRGSPSYPLLKNVSRPGGPANEFPGRAALHIGLINNAADGALQASERQFLTLVDSAARGVAVRVSLYALPDVPRTESGRRRISTFYSRIEDLWNSRLDGLIVTGAEPFASNLEQEPYWPSMTRVIEWAEHNTRSTIWSCLAAHAAVWHSDGITRRRLSEKRCGVFKCSRVSDHVLLTGVSSRFAMPHSRWNDLPEDELRACGYRILTRASAAGADTFAKQRKSLFVFFQGHPEYESKTLLHEYNRDIGRYLRGESHTYPGIPRGYFDREATEALEALRERALGDRRVELLGDFPAALAERNLSDTWRSAAILLYSNWLTYLSAVRNLPCHSRTEVSRAAHS